MTTEVIPDSKTARNILALPPNNFALYQTCFSLKSALSVFSGVSASKYGHSGGAKQVYLPLADSELLELLVEIPCP